MTILFLSIADWIKSGGAAMCQNGIDVYNGCIKVLYGILLANPSGTSSSSTPDDVASKLSGVWDYLMHGSAYQTLVTIGGVFAIVFFLVGYCKESVDITKISNLEMNLWLFIRLILSVAGVSLVATWMPTVIRAGIGVSTKLFGKPSMAGITMSGKEMLDGIDNSIVSLIFGLIFMIVMVACGAGILFIGLQRLLKLIVYACLAPVMLSTASGGSGINRSAGIWIRNFLQVAFSNVVILLAMRISSELVGMKLLDSGSNSILQAIVTIVEVVTVVGFIKLADSLLEKLLAA